MKPMRQKKSHMWLQTFFSSHSLMNHTLLLTSLGWNDGPSWVLFQHLSDGRGPKCALWWLELQPHIRWFLKLLLHFPPFPGPCPTSSPAHIYPVLLHVWPHYPCPSPVSASRLLNTVLIPSQHPFLPPSLTGYHLNIKHTFHCFSKN